MKTIGFIGGGRITRILLQAFQNAGIKFDAIYVFDTNTSVLDALKLKFPLIEASADNSIKAASSDLVFIALHPPVFMESLLSFKNEIKSNALLISLAPKITIDKLANAMPGIKNIARMNPNAGSYVNKGYNPVCFANSTDKGLITQFIDLFEKLGKVPVVPESNIEAYAVISAMGHTYFWFQLQQLKDLAISFGLTDKDANETISAMLWGTTETLFNSGLSYSEVADLVPVKPMAVHETSIKEAYIESLKAIYEKIKP